MTFLLRLFAWHSVPEWLRRPLAYAVMIGVALALLLVLKGCYERSIERAYEAHVQEQVAKATEAANTEARAVASGARSEVETTNEQVRNAAAGSTDPLRDGLGELRRAQGADRAASGRPH
jgi:hypothetical protein